jgi:uncharacterized protein YcbX
MTSPDAGLRITALTVFPLKGGRGISVTEHPLERMGLVGDRRWMLVDANGTFVSQRTHPRLVQVVPTLGTPDDPLRIRLQVPDLGEILLAPTSGEPLEVEVWDDRLVAEAPSPEADACLSKFLGVPVRLVVQPAEPIRPADPRYAPAPNTPVSLADGYPILLTTEPSLAAVNAAIRSAGGEPVGMDRFRPNVVVGDGGAGTLLPFAEDRWRGFKLGDVTCRGVKLCARCSVTTVDPDTAERGAEPLRTLARMRGWGGKTWFGQNVVPETPGILRVGDPVHLLETGWVPGAPDEGTNPEGRGTAK